MRIEPRHGPRLSLSGPVPPAAIVLLLGAVLLGCVSSGENRNLPVSPNDPPDPASRWFMYVTESNDPALDPKTDGGQVSAYQLGTDGLLPSGPPLYRFPLQNPRRVIKHPDLPIIYVATRTQVVAFDITDGKLESLCPQNNNPACTESQVNSKDPDSSPCVLESPCATISWPGTSPVEMTIANGLLYVVEQGNTDNISIATRVMAYELQADGGLPTYATSEGTDPASFSYQGIGLVPGFAFVSDPARQVIERFPLAEDGNFDVPAATPTPADGRTPTPTPTLTPEGAPTPTPTATPATTLVTGHQPAKIIELVVPSPRPSPCTSETTTLFVSFESGRKLRMVTYPVDPVTQQIPDDPVSESNTRGVYPDLLLDPSRTHVYGSAFYNGQIDRFDVNECGQIVRDTLQTTFSDTAQYPVGLDWWPAPAGGPNGSIVVALGGLGRVDTYQLGEDGSLPFRPTSSTDPRQGTFPNDVLIFGAP